MIDHVMIACSFIQFNLEIIVIVAVVAIVALSIEILRKIRVVLTHMYSYQFYKDFNFLSYPEPILTTCQPLLVDLRFSQFTMI